MNKCKNVGAHDCAQRGITLIALVITIIVMLILVAVTISMAVKGGLFEYAGKAVGETNNAIKAEQQLADGGIEVDGKWYATIDDYLAGKPAMLSYEETEKDESGMLTANATYTSGEYTAVIPKGYAISSVETEQTIATGLVIKDANNNEFVWIPVTEDLASSYSSGTNYNEPKELTSTWSDSTLETKPMYDSQEILDELYGANYYTYSEDFKYAEEYAEMVEKVNEYNGFYIGRYETTIDSEGNIGSKYNTEVLTAGTVLFTKDETDYPYRWYGLYYASKNANVTGNGSSVQTAMIYGVLWDKAMDFIRTQKAAGNTTYDVDTATSTWHGSANGHTAVVNSAQANSGDIALNIWDLESNAAEWTQLAQSTVRRVSRGCCYLHTDPRLDRCASDNSNVFPSELNGSPEPISSRIVLYIK